MSSSPGGAGRVGRVRRAGLAGLTLGLVLDLSLGCRAKRGPEDEHVQPPAPPVVAPTVVVPVDRALPGELAEGTERAFGLALPRVMVIRGSFDDVVFARGEAAADQVANYVRQRVTAEKVETGPTKTLFSRAIVKAQPGPLVSIEVLSQGGVTEMQVHDVTPKKVREGQDADERWRELGFRPDGTPLDPTHLQ